MKNYEITVNGKIYQVAVEEIEEKEFKRQQQQSNEQNQAEKTPRQSNDPSTEVGIDVVAPMPGTIIGVSVQAGESVKAGQVLCILEAMKMENEIVAPKDGTVREITVSKGVQVESGDTLVRL